MSLLPLGATPRKRGRRLEALQRLAADARRRWRRAEEALAEQRLLRREADHRVANALQLVHCTLSLRAATASGDAAKEAIRAAARSVAAAAEAHRHLHTAGVVGLATEATPDAVVYLRALVCKLTPSPDGIAVPREVTLSPEPGVAQAVSAGLLPRLGLVTAELVMNALKYGTGPVLIELRPGSKTEGGGTVVAVSDQGMGFPPEFDPAACQGTSLGMRLVAALALPGRVWVDPADRRRILVQLVDRPTV